MLDNIRPNRESESFRVKVKEPEALFSRETMGLQDPADYALQTRMRETFDYAQLFVVENGKAVLQPSAIAYGASKKYFTLGGLKYDVDACIKVLNQWLSEEENRTKRDVAETEAMRNEFDYAVLFKVANDKVVWHDDTSPMPTSFLFNGVQHRSHIAKNELTNFLVRRRMRQPRSAHETYQHKMADIAAHAENGIEKFKTRLGNTTMNKTNNFIGTVKDVFGNVARMQRGRAAVHATKRVIFSAFPIKWGVLARITGKAKAVENHPLADVAVALLAHGAANALLDDPAKRAKYLKYTEEMVAASVANAGFKMVPVEELLDKVLKGAIDSEAVQKVKDMLNSAE